MCSRLQPMCSRLQPSCVQVIQRVVRSRFPDSTILTIAHRLDTVIDYDHLLLMAEGHVAEARPTDMMCSVMCMCMYGVHTVAHTVAARQAAHINMPCTCTCTCTCACACACCATTASAVGAASLSRRVTQQSCSHGPTRSSRPSSAVARPRSGCVPSPPRQRARGGVCSRQAVARPARGCQREIESRHICRVWFSQHTGGWWLRCSEPGYRFLHIISFLIYYGFKCFALK